MMRYSLIFVTVLITACGGNTSHAKGMIQPRPVRMHTVTVAEDNITLSFSGVLAAGLETPASFEVPGRIVALELAEGATVSHGQELARIDDRDYRANLESTKANLAGAQAEYGRTKPLVEKGVLPPVELERATSGLEAAKAAHEVASKTLEETVLRAPFAGIIARRLAEVGQAVQAKQGVVLIQDLTSLKVSIAVPEGVIAQGKSTQHLDPDEITRRIEPVLLVSALPDRQFPAVLSEFSTNADPVTRTYRATFRIPAPQDARLLPGMTAEIRAKRSLCRVPACRYPCRRLLPTKNANLPFGSLTMAWPSAE